jgi:hypothetical protein
MDDQNNRTPKQSTAPAKPFFRPAKGEERTAPATEQKRRLNVPPFQGPPGARPARPATPRTPLAATRPAPIHDPIATVRAPTPVRSKTPVIVPALVVPTFPEAPPPPAAESVFPTAEDPASKEAGEPIAAAERRTSDERLDIVVGESLLELTGEYNTGWGHLQAREKAEVEPESEWDARLEEPSRGASPPDESDELTITSEGGLDWDSWEYGRNTSDFARQGDGFVINRHELSPEATDVGASSRMDGHEIEKRAEPAAHPGEEESVEEPGADFTTVAETVARDEETQPPVLSLPPISEFQMTERDELESAARLEALKEAEPWVMPGEAVVGAGERSPNAVAAALERIAQRLRRGEIVLPPGAATASDEQALSAALAAILKAPER